MAKKPIELELTPTEIKDLYDSEIIGLDTAINALKQFSHEELIKDYIEVDQEEPEDKDEVTENKEEEKKLDEDEIIDKEFDDL